MVMSGALIKTTRLSVNNIEKVTTGIMVIMIDDRSRSSVPVSLHRCTDLRSRAGAVAFPHVRRVVIRGSIESRSSVVGVAPRLNRSVTCRRTPESAAGPALTPFRIKSESWAIKCRPLRCAGHAAVSSPTESVSRQRGAPTSASGESLAYGIPRPQVQHT